MNLRNMMYGEWLRNWVNIYKKPYIKSWQTIKAHIKNHVPPKLLKTKLQSLDIVDVQIALNDIKKSRTKVELYDIYHSSLYQAYKLGLITENITDLLVKPKHIREIGTPLTTDEISALFYRLNNHRAMPFYKFCILTGCRRSESLNLEWEDINFYTDTLHIRGTKTVNSDRYFPISPLLRELLLDIPCNYRVGKVFKHRPDYVTKTFRKLCPNHKLHDLRHTFATRCLECGINISVISQWLGHTRLETTYKIYAHVLPEYVRDEMSKFKLL